jgi:hypothetical protein
MRRIPCVWWAVLVPCVLSRLVYATMTPQTYEKCIGYRLGPVPVMSSGAAHFVVGAFIGPNEVVTEGEVGVDAVGNPQGSSLFAMIRTPITCQVKASAFACTGWIRVPQNGA